MMSWLLNLAQRLGIGFQSYHKKALKISALYFLFAMLWILLSDYLNQRYVEGEGWDFPIAFQTLKGLFFVTATSVLLFVVLKRTLKALQVRQDQLIERGHRYKQLLDHLPGFVYRCYYDAYWTMVIVNEGSYRLTGYYPEDLIYNKTVAFASVIDPRDRQKVEEEVSKAVNNNQRFSISYRIRTREGNVRWAWEQGSLAFEEDGQKFLEGYITDVTQLYKLKEELGVKDVYYKMLLENANDAIFVVNFDKESCTLTQFREVNSLACERLKIPRQELLRMKPMDIEIFQNSINLEKGLHELLETSNITFETTYSGPNNQKRYSEINAHIFEIDNDPIIMAISRDVTDRVIARSMLEQKNQELKTLLYQSSHDLRSPTTNVLGLTQIALEEVEDENASHYIKLIRKSAEQMLYILESLNTASLTKKERLHIDDVDLESLLNKVLDKNVYLPGYHDVKVTKSIQESSQVKSDPVLMECIFNNLINNAIEYRNPDDPLVHVHIDSQANGVQMQVEDNGQGISEDVQSRIFDMFYRGHVHSKGSGLGLYIVKNAVDKLGGEIDFNSKVGQGTTFNIFVPTFSAVNPEKVEEI